MAIQPPPVPADPRRLANQTPPQPKAVPPQPPVPAPAAPAQAAGDGASAEPSMAVLEAAAPTDEQQAILEEQPIIEQRSFWQQPFVQDVLPFLTSLVLHIGAIAFFL